MYMYVVHSAWLGSGEVTGVRNIASLCGRDSSLSISVKPQTQFSGTVHVSPLLYLHSSPDCL